MEPQIDTLILPMVFTSVVDKVVDILVLERDEQKRLAAEAAFTPEEIESQIDFKIFKNKWNSLNVNQEETFINIYPQQESFPIHRQFHNHFTSDLALNLELYAARGSIKIEREGENDDIIAGDELAEFRLEYLIAQVLKILGSEKWNLLGLKGIVEKMTFSNWVRIEEPELENEQKTLLGVRIQLNVEFKETFQNVRGNELNSLLQNTRINNKLIEPLVEVSYEEEQQE
jgi:hypothetical protein